MRIRITILLIWWSAVLAAQTWSIDTTVIRIGEPIEITFQAEADTDSLKFPDYQAWWDNGFVLVEVDSLIEKKKSNGYAYHQRLVITSFDTGFAVLEPVVFQSLESKFSSDPIMIEVEWVMIEEGQSLFDIKDVMGIPRPWYFYALWILGILLVLAAAYYLWIYLKNKKSEELPVHIPQKLPAEIALEKIQYLRASHLWENERYGLFFLELTTIVRQYMERVYDIRVMEATLSELHKAIDALPLSDAQVQELRAFFDHAEMVKYAKVSPARSNQEAYLLQAEKFVDEIRPLIRKDQENV